MDAVGEETYEEGGMRQETGKEGTPSARQTLT
jgi:hypothetical protein